MRALRGLREGRQNELCKIKTTRQSRLDKRSISQTYGRNQKAHNRTLPRAMLHDQKRPQFARTCGNR